MKTKFSRKLSKGQMLKTRVRPKEERPKGRHPQGLGCPYAEAIPAQVPGGMHSIYRPLGPLQEGGGRLTFLQHEGLSQGGDGPEVITVQGAQGLHRDGGRSAKIHEHDHHPGVHAVQHPAPGQREGEEVCPTWSHTERSSWRGLGGLGRKGASYAAPRLGWKGDHKE